MKKEKNKKKNEEEVEEEEEEKDDHEETTTTAIINRSPTLSSHSIECSCQYSSCHPRITAVVTHVDPGHFAKTAGGMLQLNTHAFYVCGFHEVTWCMVVWCTQNLRRDGSSFMWHQPCQHCKYTSSVDIQKRAIKS